MPLLRSSQRSHNPNMELLFFIGFILLIVFPFFALFSYARKTNPSNPNPPPGRTGFPLIGENLEFLSKCRKGHPQQFIHERMAKFSSQIFNNSIFGEPMAVICGAAGNKFLFSNENKLVTAWWPKLMNKLFLSSASSEETKRLRTLLSSLLKSEALQTYIGMMDSIAQRHFESAWEGRKEVSVFPLAKNYTFLIACKVLLSIEDPKQVNELARPFNVLLAGMVSIPIDFPGTTFNRSIKASKKARKELTAIVKQRKIYITKCKASPEQDIMSRMWSATDVDGQDISESKIADKILGLLVAGHDTASTVITSIVKYLAELPDIYQKVLTEQMEIAQSKAPGELLNWNDIQKMKYSWNVACEAMRLVPPAQGAFREALDEFSYAGFTIPKDSKLFWSVHTTNRNPECFSGPEKFDPSRFEGNGPAPYTFVPFGGGPRMCPGKEYARMEILVFIHNIVKRYYWEKTIPNEKIIFDPLPKPAYGLPIRLLPPKCI